MPENPYSSPNAPLDGTPSGVLAEAPGARAAFHCGLWALISTVLCLPASIALGIIALVQSKKAKRFAQEEPGRYAPPSGAGMIMAIIALAVLPVLMIIGMVSALAIPALLGQRDRARDRAAMENVITQTQELAARCNEVFASGGEEASIVPLLESHLRERGGLDKNPWNPAQPAFSSSVTVMDNMDRETLIDFARSQATVLGQGTFVLQLPSKSGESVQHDGHLVGATRIKRVIDTSNVFVKAIDF